MTLLATYQTAVAAATTTKAKGEALEQLACESFARLDGVTVHARNCRDEHNIQEIDVVLWNDRLATPIGLPFIPEVFTVEAKNWEAPVGSAEVAWFKEKVRNSGYSTGVLVAANGITGDHDDRRFAYEAILLARSERLRLVVLEPAALGAAPNDLAQTLKMRLADLAAGRVGP